MSLTAVDANDQHEAKSGIINIKYKIRYIVHTGILASLEGWFGFYMGFVSLVKM